MAHRARSDRLGPGCSAISSRPCAKLSRSCRRPNGSHWLVGPPSSLAALLTGNIDLASDYRLMDARATEAGFVLDVEELAADKVLALEARGVPRDYIDFAALNGRFSVEQMCELAVQKDTGFDPARLAGMLRRFFDLTPRVFGLDDDEHTELENAITAALGDLERVIAAQGRDGL